ncbi:hypothetical protein IEO21_02213 [Rhodonia placenta]|uniref:BTB domain-containing protein n=1 Tax=Rhodonia placenta TaxID=104341 RepID=A0A8H7U556_9APHY|nr:hypothetical protein IEO21_02213 [Postia placenta]
MDSDSKNVDTNNATPQTHLDFTRSRDVWFSDGSVVLVADKTAFRVHATILAMHSEVFGDMFTMPQPSEADLDAETYDTCPVLRLQDSPVDLKHFLKSIYDFSYFPAGVKTQFPLVAAVLRLSTKYHAPVFRKRAIDLLATAYPSTAVAWQRRSSDRLIPPFPDELLTYIELAIEMDVPVILPALYYAAARKALPEAHAELSKHAVAPSVQRDVYTNFYLGRERLLQAELTHVLAFFDTGFSFPNCQNRHDSEVLDRAARSSLRKLAGPDPYHLWCSAHPSKAASAMGVCVNCTNTIRSSIQAGCQTVWEQLPGFFGLPDWETLLGMDDGPDIIVPKLEEE